MYKINFSHTFTRVMKFTVIDNMHTSTAEYRYTIQRKIIRITCVIKSFRSKALSNIIITCMKEEQISEWMNEKTVLYLCIIWKLLLSNWYAHYVHRFLWWGRLIWLIDWWYIYGHIVGTCTINLMELSYADSSCLKREGERKKDKRRKMNVFVFMCWFSLPRQVLITY